jgi:hypothetical protein
MYTISVRKVMDIEVKAKTTFFTEAAFSMQVDSMQEFKVWAINHMDAKDYVARNGNRVYYVRIEEDEVIASILHKAITLKPYKAPVVVEEKPVLCGNCSYWVEEISVDEEGIEWKKNVHKKLYHASIEGVKECFALAQAEKDSQKAEIEAEKAVERFYEERGAEVLFDNFEYGIEEYDEEPISLDE